MDRIFPKPKLSAAVATILMMIVVTVSLFLWTVNTRLKEDLRSEKLRYENLLGEKLGLEKELNHIKKEIKLFEQNSDSLERKIAEMVKFLPTTKKTLPLK